MEWEKEWRAAHDRAFDVVHAQKVEDLIKAWAQRALRKMRAAELETDPAGRRLLEHGATSLYNCARELQALLQPVCQSAGDLGLGEITQNAD